MKNVMKIDEIIENYYQTIEEFPDVFSKKVKYKKYYKDEIFLELIEKLKKSYFKKGVLTIFFTNNFE